MLLPAVLLLLAAVLQQSLGKQPIVANMNEKLQVEIVEQINEIRREVKPSASNMLKMTWSEKAAESAKNWASECIARSSPLKQRYVDGILCGESLSQSNFERSWSKVIEHWYNSGATFKYGHNEFGKEKDYLGYTQMVWYNSHEVGCAFVRCPELKSSYFYMCRFCPLGNIEETLATPYKEGPSCGDCPDNCEDRLCTNPCKYANSSPDCEELLEYFNCDQSLTQETCEASCKCKTEII
ncbi:cysteine-rich venom protein TEL1-like isoform X2 [Zootoca vivipara]|uniref:cysteine-rich venom protein TEL1-like isoform X2 n=1 Tax=Zootoca vivipara TaxID=8524 RepID=UPI00159299AB|nr:cysteine-rich venom protein TEL1-like isoform X2 [Zootoca vivipara]